MSEVRVRGLTGMPEIRAGDDLATLLIEALRRQELSPEPGDVLVVTQKVVSKAEGRVVDLRTIEPSPLAISIGKEHGKRPDLIEAILRESRRIVRMDRGVLIVETHHGYICANAGVDQSNIPGEHHAALLPTDPDASAARIRAAIGAALGTASAVIISDTFGRPWREGTTEVALGVAGMPAVRSYAGVRDPYGYEMRTSVIAVADELASTAELVCGKIEGVPAALIRGYRIDEGEGSGRDLIRDRDHDLFR